MFSCEISQIFYIFFLNNISGGCLWEMYTKPKYEAGFKVVDASLIKQPRPKSKNENSTKNEIFGKTVNGLYLLTIFAKKLLL